MLKLYGHASMLSLLSVVSCTQMMPPPQSSPPPVPVAPVATAPSGAGVCHTEEEILSVSGRVRLGKAQKDEDPRKGYYKYAYILFDHPTCLKDENAPNGEMVKRAEYTGSKGYVMSAIGHHVRASGNLYANMMGDHAEAFDFMKR